MQESQKSTDIGKISEMVGNMQLQSDNQPGPEDPEPNGNLLVSANKRSTPSFLSILMSHAHFHGFESTCLSFIFHRRNLQ